ncbi:group 1 truncated hemoglobin [Hahella sp. KA22]|uniref:group I truncated hemoglobin n=1 Tax=Hahella sp. KA22 TaxID=1628392 RepID=UPI000FDE72C6|nr:group 1 truncated hemoglobin [Hahella sp. KA22]AZZ93972.1 group 1 truncated hemoglobin [Hahella sp. KA22]QAY57346.1 group 1 truncated hemoglobin [Hahella sp. KA22]
MTQADSQTNSLLRDAAKTIAIALTAVTLYLAGCASVSQDASLYRALGGEQGIARLVDRFVEEISYSKDIAPFFADTDPDRFKEKLSEQLCNISGGPCAYTGDSMRDSHAGLSISEADFNKTVDLLINAMNKEGVPYPTQNRLLKRLAPMRKDIIYL